MRQVDACDFCGDAPEGVFEVVPAAVPDGPVRLALCADCQRTLETVVEPLLDARDADDNGSEDARTGDSTAAAEPASGSATARDSRDERPAAAAASSDARDASDAPESGDDTTATERDDGDAGGDGDDTDSDDDDDDDGVTIEASSSEPPAERPDGYAQVLRLLENRDGGMPRSDLRSLATNAYDLTDASFEAAVEAAVENGDVEDTAGGLRRT